MSLVSRILFLSWLLLLLQACGVSKELARYPAPLERPAHWAEPLALEATNNCHRVSQQLIRCAQPTARGFEALKALGVSHVLNLRQYHADDNRARGSALTLYRLPMDAGAVTEAQLREAVALIDSLDAPLVVHCWHGADRTGAVVAAYRILRQGWTHREAVSEMIHGGYGFHSIYDNLIILLERLEPETSMHQGGALSRNRALNSHGYLTTVSDARI
jgi:tyrosine-protein phosphatase SIW14